MGTISLSLPQIGQPDSTEDVKIPNAFTILQNVINGNLDGTNLAAATAQSAGVNQSGQTIKGVSNIATSQSTSSLTYTTLATPDQVTGIVLPTNGLIQVWYQATWQESVANAARANIFLNNVAVKRQQSGQTNLVNTYASINHAAADVLLSTWGGGLASLNGGTFGGAYGGDATTGQVVGGGTAIGDVTTPLGTATFGWYGPCWIFAAAGTYTVSVQFLVSSGTVTVKSRQLWVQASSFA